MPARTGMVATRSYVDTAVAAAVSTTGTGAIAQELTAIRASITALAAKAVQYNDVATEVVISGNLTVTGDLAIGTVDVMSRFESIETAVAGKQATLTAGTGISISASNLISLSRGIDSTVSAGSANLVTSSAVAAYVLGQSFTLPKATVSTLGGVIVGSGLSINANGVLSASGESNTIEGVKLYGATSTLLPDGNKVVTIPLATPTAYGILKVDTSGSLSVSNGVLSSSGQANVLNEVILAGHTSPLTPTAKRITIPMATSGGLSGLVKLRGGYSKLYIDADGFLCTTGEANAVTDVKDELGNSFIPAGGTEAAIPYASAAAFGLVKIGNGLAVTGGVASVKYGYGLAMASDGTLKVDANTVAEKIAVDAKADQTDLDATNANVDNLSAAMNNFEISSGASDMLFTCTPDTNGDVVLHNHGINLVSINLSRTSVNLIVPVASSTLISRDMYVLLSFSDAWTGDAFSLTIKSATAGETLSFFKTATGTFDFTGIAAGEKLMFYLTEIAASTFMASSKKLIAHTFS